MIGIRGAVARHLILACAAFALVPAAASAQGEPQPHPAPVDFAALERPPIDEGFNCRASSVRLSTSSTDPEATRLEPFVANRDTFPCVDADSGAPGLTQLGEADGPHGVIGAAFARTRDGEADPEAPDPPEELGIIRSEAGAANVLLSSGEQQVHVVAVRAEASVDCVNGLPVFRSSS